VSTASHARLVAIAKEAINAVFTDRSVSLTAVDDSLGELADEIDILRDAAKAEANPPDGE
jgi:phage protein D